MNFRRFVFIVFACLLKHSVQASCLPPPVYQTTFEVLSCEQVDLNKLHPPPNWQGLPSYQGVILDINILSTKKTKLQKGYNHSAIERLPNKARVFYQTTEKQPCAALSSGTKRKGIRTSACCDGDPNAPCLLELSDYVYELKE